MGLHRRRLGINPFQPGPLALRRAGHGSDDGVFYMLQDHLGSTATIVNQAGVIQSRQYYHPYGDARSALSTLTTKRSLLQHFSWMHQQRNPPLAAGLFV